MTRSACRAVFSLLVVAGGMGTMARASADTPEPAAQPPDESVLGTVDVTGAAAAPLPKLAVMPIVTTNEADTTLQLVVKKDLDLSGQFEVVSDDAAPSGLYLHDSPVDVAAWRSKGIAILVRVLANKLPSGKIELLGSAYFVGRGATPAFEHRIESDAALVRPSSHRMTDALLGALSGRPGGFASHMVYSGRVGRNRQIFGIDADGFNLHTESPVGDTAIAPTFGPKGEPYYALSHDYSPFRLVRGPSATPVPITLPGSVFGIAFSSDHSKIAVSVARDGTSHIHVGSADGTGLQAISTVPLANHPVFGPGGKIAYVGGGPAGQRVYVEGKPISPAGFNASAPAFCDTPNGLVVVFTVGIGAGADLVSTDARGGNITRITQNQGANSYPACSPDGRLLAFFSTRKTDKGPGLYVVPLAGVWRAKRISSELGESLRWEALP
ncbi:MAG TPA: tolB protein [Polyangiaceae bacterium]|nr:tolB protein [Polyangiaceae bacterium]